MARINKVTKVTTRKYSYRQMVERIDPKRKTRPEVVYEFGGNRNFAGKRNPYK